jgi:lipoprotein-releasing system ATP-binding protein
MPLVSVQNLHKSYPTAGGKALEVLAGIDLEVEKGEVVAIVGESGTGKSTLLHLMGALDRPDTGQVLFNGRNIFDGPDKELARFRNDSIGFVFQFHHLLPEFSALENVAMPALIKGIRMRVALKRAEMLLERMGLSERGHHMPSEMSGGEQQRVAVSRALMNDPALILADEPTGNLDVKTSERLHQELLGLSRDLGQTFIVVTHNLELASGAHRILNLEGGRLTPCD